MGRLRYYLGIKIADTQTGLCLSQRKYFLELLNEIGLLVSKPAATPIEQSLVIQVEESEKDKKKKKNF